MNFDIKVILSAVTKGVSESFNKLSKGMSNVPTQQKKVNEVLKAGTVIINTYSGANAKTKETLVGLNKTIISNQKRIQAFDAEIQKSGINTKRYALTQEYFSDKINKASRAMASAKSQLKALNKAQSESVKAAGMYGTKSAKLQEVINTQSGELENSKKSLANYNLAHDRGRLTNEQYGQSLNKLQGVMTKQTNDLSYSKKSLKGLNQSQKDGTITGSQYESSLTRLHEVITSQDNALKQSKRSLKDLNDNYAGGVDSTYEKGVTKLQGVIDKQSGKLDQSKDKLASLNMEHEDGVNNNSAYEQSVARVQKVISSQSNEVNRLRSKQNLELSTIKKSTNVNQAHETQRAELVKQNKQMSATVSQLNQSLMPQNRIVTKLRRTNEGAVETQVKSTKVGNQFVETTRTETKGLEGFRMEMLGVMFFGMQMQRTFTGMLTPAAEVFGIFDLWRTMLTIVFLPIMETLAPILYDFMLWFMDLDPAVQKGIGAFVIFAAIIGTVLFVMGVLGLGIVSMAQWFPVLFGGISSGASIPALLTGLFTTLSGSVSTLALGFVGLAESVGAIGLDVLKLDTTAALAKIKTGITALQNNKLFSKLITIGLLIGFAITINEALKTAKGGDFDAKDAIWHALKTGLLAGAAAGFIKPLGPYALIIAMMAAIAVNVAFMLESDFGKKAKLWAYDTLNKIIAAWNDAVKKTGGPIANWFPTLGKVEIPRELEKFRQELKDIEHYSQPVTGTYLTKLKEEISVDPYLGSYVAMGRMLNPTSTSQVTQTITIAPVINVTSPIDERELADQIGEIVTKEVSTMSR